MSDSAAFAQIANEQLSFLVEERGFKVAEQDTHHVRLESDLVVVEAWHDPRGEVDVYVSPLGSTDRYARWTYTGMEGQASVPRLLQIAAERMRAEPEILHGDATYYAALAAENQRVSEDLTTRYSGPESTEN